MKNNNSINLWCCFYLNGNSAKTFCNWLQLGNTDVLTIKIKGTGTHYLFGGGPGDTLRMHPFTIEQVHKSQYLQRRSFASAHTICNSSNRAEKIAQQRVNRLFAIVVDSYVLSAARDLLWVASHIVDETPNDSLKNVFSTFMKIAPTVFAQKRAVDDVLVRNISEES